MPPCWAPAIEDKNPIGCSPRGAQVGLLAARSAPAPELPRSPGQRRQRRDRIAVLTTPYSGRCSVLRLPVRERAPGNDEPVDLIG